AGGPRPSRERFCCCTSKGGRSPAKAAPISSRLLHSRKKLCHGKEFSGGRGCAEKSNGNQSEPGRRLQPSCLDLRPNEPPAGGVEGGGYGPGEESAVCAGAFDFGNHLYANRRFRQSTG